MVERQERSMELQGPFVPGTCGVNGIPTQRVAVPSEVSSYLVGAARLQPRSDQGSRRVPAEDFEVGNCGFPTGQDLHLQSIPWIASQWCVDGKALLIEGSPGQAHVPTFGSFVLDLGLEVPMGGVILGDHHESGGFSIEAVHDAGTEGPAFAAEAMRAGKQCVD